MLSARFEPADPAIEPSHRPIYALDSLDTGIVYEIRRPKKWNTQQNCYEILTGYNLVPSQRALRVK
jgi:hypothetical protein